MEFKEDYGDVISFSIKTHSPIECYSSAFDIYEPDRSWSYKDHRGHKHQWDPVKDKINTLKEVIDYTELEYDYEEDTWLSTNHTHLECIFCGEVINPRKLGAYKIKYNAYEQIPSDAIITTTTGSYETHNLPVYSHIHKNFLGKWKGDIIIKHVKLVDMCVYKVDFSVFKGDYID